ncbi:MAG: Lrp/AsnC ligand binding domain-containing protein [Lentisphaeria bacterium]|nr:Lrp/AsnC ligand binding domain-containing protein [Lentisphaeria bacterium]
MVTAFVLIQVQDKKVRELAEQLLGFAGVTEVHVVAGEYDIVAVVRVADNHDLSDLITRRIVPAPGVGRTKTLFSLECHSTYALEALFGSG